MSRADGVLVVVLKRKPFEDIRAGIKLEEYRGMNWAGKLLHVSYSIPWDDDLLARMSPAMFYPYHTLRAYLGYSKGRPMIELPIRGIRWGTPNPEWTYGIMAPGQCFIIELGS